MIKFISFQHLYVLLATSLVYIMFSRSSHDMRPFDFLLLYGVHLCMANIAHLSEKLKRAEKHDADL